MTGANYRQMCSVPKDSPQINFLPASMAMSLSLIMASVRYSLERKLHISVLILAFQEAHVSSPARFVKNDLNDDV